MTLVPVARVLQITHRYCGKYDKGVEEGTFNVMSAVLKPLTA